LIEVAARKKIGMDEIVAVEDLHKTYGKDIIAVDGISFTVKKGEIFGFLGPNGAGKTTLFNLLTKSQFQVEDKLFSTLDTATRRLRFPGSYSGGRKIHEVVITDTVGLIKDLPRDLIGAFRPTFDELQESNLLIHLIDISSPCYQEHIEAVEKIFFELSLNQIPVLRVFNKEDRLNHEEGEAICQKYGGVSISIITIRIELSRFLF
jgi:GTP-binding protein HflX